LRHILCEQWFELSALDVRLWKRLVLVNRIPFIKETNEMKRILVPILGLLAVAGGYQVAIQTGIIRTVRAAVGDRQAFTAFSETAAVLPGSSEAVVKERATFAVQSSGTTAILQKRLVSKGEVN